MSVAAARAGRAAATPLRSKLDLMGVNRNYCVAGVVAVAGAVVFVVLSLLISQGACLDAAACPAGEEESLTCNCEKFRWAMGPGLLAVAVFITVYELCTGEGKKEMMKSRAAATQSLLGGGE